MILNCKIVAEQELDKVQEEVDKLRVQPWLRIIRVDGDQASEKYVNNKVRKCAERGIKSDVKLLPNNTDMDTLLSEIHKANFNMKITGVLLQLPLPKHLDPLIAINAIDPKKDVDCLTTYNVGKLFEGDHTLAPCTPKGIMSVLEYNNIKLEGKDVLIINRSMLVGKPLAELMQAKNATVTLAHSKTRFLFDKMRKADIIVTAVGKQDFINKAMLDELNLIAKKYCNDKVIVDVSINVNEDGKLCGDVYKNNDYIESLSNLYITPVPGGVGLTTVATLLTNTIICTKNR